MAKGVLVVFVPVVASGFIAILLLMAPMRGSGHTGAMGGDSSSPGEESAIAVVPQVRVKDFAFAPANIVIDVGTTVTWTNYGSFGHTVTSDGGEELGSPLFWQSETFSHTFDQAGEYRYYCEPHPNMTGLVSVRALKAS